MATSQSWLAWFARGIALVGFLIITARLLELQVIKADYYKSLADANRIRRVIIDAPRGKILSREGEVLVDNKEIVKTILFDSELGYVKSTAISGDGQQIKEAQRNYVLGESFSHVSGYLGEVGEDEVGKINPDCPEKGPFKLGQLVGRSGLERHYECQLAGTNGEVLLEVDTTGSQIRVLGIKEPLAGSDLKTNISKSLQEFVAKAHPAKGAVVVTDTQGAVLALQSFPAFDPDSFINKNKQAYLSEILVDQDLPLFNRTISGSYHPGSVFKPVVIIGALTEGAIDKNFRYTDTGIITVNDFSYTNWYFTQYGSTEGEIGIPKALARSTDTFFYKVGEHMGAENLAKWATLFGFGKQTGIDLPSEVAGLVPSPKWKENTKGENWFLGNTYHFAIGQGDLQTTPIQVNSSIQAIANETKLCTPHIAGDSNSCEAIDYAKEDKDLVVEGMIGACATGGTAYPFFDFRIGGEADTASTTAEDASEVPQVAHVACKTGTAETLNADLNHAWFSVFAPVEFPEIVVTVLVEDGGEGSSAAAPIAREILDFWFNKDEVVNFEKYPDLND